MANSDLINAIRKVVPKGQQRFYLGKIISGNPLLLSVAGIQVDDEDMYRPPDLELNKDDEVAVVLLEKDDAQDFVILNKVVRG